MKATSIFPKIILFLILCTTQLATAQVGIGTTSPADGALLDINSTNKGILIPRVTLTGINDNTTISPATVGLLVFNTTAANSGANAINEGFYYWNGIIWVRLTTGSGTTSDTSLYNNDGTITDDFRIINMDSNLLGFYNNSGADNYLFLSPAGHPYTPDDYYWSSSTGLGFAVSSTTQALLLDSNGDILFNQYGSGAKTGTPAYSLAIDNTGKIIETSLPQSFDWYEENTTVAPDNINNNIWTNGQVGIGINDPNAGLHIFENTGTPASATTGSIVLEHGNAGGESSIVFKSRANNNSDYGYINFSDDGSSGSSNENALLEIGIQNDGVNIYQDNINIASTGSVGVSNRNPSGSASLDLGATNRGLLLNRVALTSINDNTTIQNPATGLFVYNTSTAGSGTIRVQPGLYYWNGSLWSRVFAKGFSVQHKQSNEVRATNNNTYVNLPGLTQNFTAPTSGKYQIIVNGYHSSGTPQNNLDAASQGSIRLRQDNTTIGEKYVTSVSKYFTGQSFYSLGQSLVIIVNTDLIAGQTYSFNVQGREWTKYNADAGYFGRNTNVYAGNNGVAEAQYGDLTITLITEY